MLITYSAEMRLSILHCVLTLWDVFNHTSIWERPLSSEMKESGFEALILFLLKKRSKRLNYFWGHLGPVH